MRTISNITNNNIFFYNFDETTPYTVQKEKFLQFLSIEYLKNKKKLFLISNNKNSFSFFNQLHEFKKINIVNTSLYFLFKDKSDINKFFIENLKQILKELNIYKKLLNTNTLFNLFEENQKFDDFINNKYNKKHEKDFLTFLQENIKEINYNNKNLFYISLYDIFDYLDLYHLNEIIDTDITIEEYLNILSSNINIIVNSIKENLYVMNEIYDKNIIQESNILAFNIRQLGKNVKVLSNNKKEEKFSLFFNLFNINNNYFNVHKFSLILNNFFYFINKNYDYFYIRMPIINFNILKSVHTLFENNKMNYIIGITDINFFVKDYNNKFLNKLLKSIIIFLDKKILYDDNNLDLYNQNNIEKYIIENKKFTEEYKNLLLYDEVLKLIYNYEEISNNIEDFENIKNVFFAFFEFIKDKNLNLKELLNYLKRNKIYNLKTLEYEIINLSF